MTLLNSFMLALGMNILLFFPAYIFRTDKITDGAYCLTFIVISIFSFLYSEMTFGAWLLLGMIGLWAFRLGMYLLLRIRKIGHDKRFDEMRGHWGKFLGFWILQGFTVWVVLLPSLLYFRNIIFELSWISWIGLAIWGLGLGIETLADIQKNNFYRLDAHKGKWIESGLWRYSRHPNYFGEILVWIGIYLYTLAAMDFWQSMLGILSPLYISALIIFVSGIPILEKSADAKYGTNPDYLRYKINTNSLILWRSRKK